MKVLIFALTGSHLLDAGMLWQPKNRLTVFVITTVAPLFGRALFRTSISFFKHAPTRFWYLKM
jgi:hypothetical protein